MAATAAAGYLAEKKRLQQGLLLPCFVAERVREGAGVAFVHQEGRRNRGGGLALKKKSSNLLLLLVCCSCREDDDGLMMMVL